MTVTQSHTTYKRRPSGLAFVVPVLIIQLVRYTLLANGIPDAAALVVKAVIILGAVFIQEKGRSERLPVHIETGRAALWSRS
jgi:zona occludens toxin (predicted ATPase)